MLEAILGDIDESGLEKTKNEIKELIPTATVYISKVDIHDENSVQHLIDACVETFGRIDYAANVAGIVPQRIPIHEVDTETYDRVIAVNEYGVSGISISPSRQFSAAYLSE